MPRVVLGLMLALMLALPLPASGAHTEPTSMPAQPFLSGMLDGDAQLSGGCVWLERVGSPPGKKASRYQPLWPEGYFVTFDPVTLWKQGPDPDDEPVPVAKKGDTVSVAGRVRRDSYTICMVGPVYEVWRVLAVNGKPVLLDHKQRPRRGET